MTTFEIGIKPIHSLEDFYQQFDTIVLKEKSSWGKNLDALDDVLRGGMGTPEDGFEIIWHNSDVSEKSLGEKFDIVCEIFSQHPEIPFSLA